MGGVAFSSSNADGSVQMNVAFTESVAANSLSHRDKGLKLAAKRHLTAQSDVALRHRTMGIAR
jgi:hypothetical protein